MTITPEAVPVYLALIGLVTLIVQGLFASRDRGKAAKQLTEIHTLTNSGMSEVRSQLSTALGRIEELNKALFARQSTGQPVAVIAASMAGAAPAPASHPSSILTGGEASAAIAVAEAAVEKKDQIVADSKK